MTWSPFSTVLLLFVAAGFAVILWSVRGIARDLRGVPQLTGTGLRIPLFGFCLMFFFGAMCIAAALPGLFGEPLWLLEKLFSVVRLVLET
jgi:hypothetical protein